METRYQTFDDVSERAHSAQRLTALRAELARRNLDGFIVPRADRHQNEYVPPCDERLMWLTGFAGSAGSAIVLAHRAALFVDGRYTLQAADQIDTTLVDVVPIATTTPQAWIEANMPAGKTLGYDPWLHTADNVERLTTACERAGASLVAVDANPLDAVWTGRAPLPRGRIVLHPMDYAGEASADKLARIRDEIAKLKADVLVVSDPHAVAWTFNIRGSDVAHTPLVLAFAIIPAHGRPALFVDARKLDNVSRDALEPLADLREPEAFTAALDALGHEKKTVRLDNATAAQALSARIEAAGGKAVRGSDALAMMKAVKNEAEMAGARAAHLRDGVAMARFLAWLDREAPSGRLTEIEAVEALEGFRRDTGRLKDVSFPTISGSGPNGAIVHYRVTRATDRAVQPGELFLIDSGAQYEDGTTDITRTVAVGTPSDEMRDRFTRVLKGHIAIARAVFPVGTSGAQLDSFARLPLWQAGLDFDHGTGHGVGSYLSVHEGPARISKLGSVALEPGMILSNEPGYYKAGAFGIRIENLVLVTRAEAIAGAEKTLLRFETLTLAPIDRRLIDAALLTPDEIAWLDAYHARVAQLVSPALDAADRAWLADATAPIAAH